MNPTCSHAVHGSSCVRRKRSSQLSESFRSPTDSERDNSLIRPFADIGRRTLSHHAIFASFTGVARTPKRCDSFVGQQNHVLMWWPLVGTLGVVRGPVETPLETEPRSARNNAHFSKTCFLCSYYGGFRISRTRTFPFLLFFMSTAGPATTVR